MMLRRFFLFCFLLCTISKQVSSTANGSGNNAQPTTSKVNGATELNTPRQGSMAPDIDGVPPNQATDPNAKPAGKWSLRNLLSSLPDWKTVKNKLTPNWSKVSPKLKKVVPDWNKWKGRYASCFKTSPRNFEGTLKVKKVSLVAFYELMDKHIFEIAGNPYAFHIRHFDVRRHIFASTHIKLPKEDKTATSVKLIRIFERFLRECLEPLLILYEERLNVQRGKELSKVNAVTSTAEAPRLVSKNKRRFKFPKISLRKFLPKRNQKYQKKSEESSQNGKNDENASDSKDEINSSKSAETIRQDSKPQPPSEPKPKVPLKQRIAEKSKKVTRQVKQGLLKGSKVGLKEGLKYTGKGVAFAITLPFKAISKGKEIVEDEIIDRVSEKMIEKGWKNPPEERVLKPLSYPQKAFLYRLLVWLNKMVFIDDFEPCSVAKAQGYLKPIYKSFDCVPHSAEDLEQCKDIKYDLMVEYLLKITEKYEKNAEKDETENYLDYPSYPDRFEIVIFIEKFHCDKYEEFFRMTPNVAKKIIRRQFYYKKMKEREELITQRRFARERKKLIKKMIRDGLLIPDPVTGEVVLSEDQEKEKLGSSYTTGVAHTTNSGILNSQNQLINDGTQKLMTGGKKGENKETATNSSGIWYYLSYLNPAPLVKWTINSLKNCAGKKTTANQQNTETNTLAASDVHK